MPVDPLETYRFCREEIKHEYNVLGNRLTSYITSQSFLFTTYAVSMTNVNPTFRLLFPFIVCSVGFMTSLRAQPGILSASKILNALHDRQLALRNNPDVLELDPFDHGWSVRVHKDALKFSVAAAYIFEVAWAVMLALAIGLYFNPHRP